MRLKKILFGSAVIITLFLPMLGLARTCDGGAASPVGNAEVCNPVAGVGGTTFESFGTHVLQVFAASAGILTIIYVMFSGFRFLISQGNSEDVEAAKRSLQWSISGLVVMLFSYVLISALYSFFGVKTIPGPDTAQVTNPLAANSFNDLYLIFINGFLGLVGLLAVLMIIINGVRYITARGNDEQAENAKQGVTYAVLGVVIVLFAYVIVRATATFFGASK